MSNSGKTLKEKASTAILWSGFERIAIQAMQLVFGIILARILLPEQFGLISMLYIFIVLAEVFINSGMGSGLIQKIDRTEEDFSTVFLFNILVSLCCYFILFFSAPFIAEFYNAPELKTISRVLLITLVLNAAANIHRTKLIIDVDFKVIAKINFISFFLSGVVAVSLAYFGYGVWALVAQAVVRAALSLSLYWYFAHWYPSFSFSPDSFKDIFAFGSKLLIAKIVSQTTSYTYNVLIGRFYPVQDLGYFTKARGYTDMAAGSATNILKQVSFPILADIKTDQQRMISVYKRLIRMAAFLTFPAMTILAILAEPFIILFLTEKWAPAISLLQWLSFAMVLLPISTINLSMFNANGRSDLFLWISLIKAPLTIIAIIITIPYGLQVMVIGMVIVSLIGFFIDAYYAGKLFRFGVLKQLKTLIAFAGLSAVMAIVVLLIKWLLVSSMLLQIIIAGTVGLLFFLLLAHFLRFQEMKEVLTILKKLLKNA